MAEHFEEIPESCPPAWAHTVGALDLGKVQAVPTSLDVIADRLMLQESAARYALGYDERRLEVLDDLFTDDMIFAFAVSGGGFLEVSGREEVVKWLHDIMLSQFDQRRHVCGNFIVEELDDSSARVTQYLALFASAEGTELVTTGFYRMDMRKVDGKWKISYIYDGLDRPF